MERERALVDAAELEKKEEEFHLAQARMRAEIRLREGRPKPIDLLARNVACSSFHAFDFRLDPVALFDNLTGPELAELEFDLRSLQDLERGDKEHFEFWSARCPVSVWSQCASKSHLKTFRTRNAHARPPGTPGTAGGARLLAGGTAAEPDAALLFSPRQNLVTVCRQELIEVRKREAEDRARLLGRVSAQRSPPSQQRPSAPGPPCELRPPREDR